MKAYIDETKREDPKSPERDMYEADGQQQKEREIEREPDGRMD